MAVKKLKVHDYNMDIVTENAKAVFFLQQPQLAKRCPRKPTFERQEMQLRPLNTHRLAMTSNISFSETKPGKVTISSKYKTTVPSTPH